MQVLIVAALVLTRLLAMLPAPLAPAPVWALGPLAAAYVAAAGLLAALAAWRHRQHLLGPRSDDPPRAARALATAAQAYLLAGVVGLMLAGWGHWLVSLVPWRVPLLDEAASLAPFVAALLAYWAAMYPAEAAARRRLQEHAERAHRPAIPIWTLGQYLAFNLRHHLLFVLAPAALVLLAMDLLARLDTVLGPAAAGGAALAAAGAVFVAAPSLIVRIWQTSPLADGPLRRRLEELCRILALAYRRLLVWHTGGVIINAGVMGLLGRVRYILLSDALLDNLDRHSVEAVFCHEAGHVAARHILYMILFTGALLTLLTYAAAALLAPLGLGQAQAELLAATPVGVAWLLSFGYLSRQFERQADVYAAAVMSTQEEVAPQALEPVPAGSAGQAGSAAEASARAEVEPRPPPAPARWRLIRRYPRFTRLGGYGVAAFSTALLDVARLNGIPPRRWNFRHGSIHQRVEFLSRLLIQGQGTSPVDRHIRRIKLVIWLLVAGAAAVVVLA